MKVPGGCKLTSNGVHQWILIDTAKHPSSTMYLFACRFCLGVLARFRESLESVPEVEEEFVNA